MTKKELKQILKDKYEMVFWKEAIEKVAKKNAIVTEGYQEYRFWGEHKEIAAERDSDAIYQQMVVVDKKTDEIILVIDPEALDDNFDFWFEEYEGVFQDIR